VGFGCSEVPDATMINLEDINLEDINLEEENQIDSSRKNFIDQNQSKTESDESFNINKLNKNNISKINNLVKRNFFKYIDEQELDISDEQYHTEYESDGKGSKNIDTLLEEYRKKKKDIVSKHLDNSNNRMTILISLINEEKVSDYYEKYRREKKSIPKSQANTLQLKLEALLGSDSNEFSQYSEC